MAKNLNCNCLCHGSNGNRIGDDYFSCKNCYAANHMNSLASSKPVKRKPLKKTTEVKPDVETAVKVVARSIMNDIADAAESINKA